MDVRREAALVCHQIRYEQLSFWRNPQNAVFTFAFPLVLIVTLGAVFPDDSNSDFYHGLSSMQYYVPTVAVLSVLNGCYAQLAMVLAVRRQDGVLKRLHATPLPAWAYFSGLLAHCLMIAVVQISLIVGIGRFYGAPAPANWSALLLILVVGAGSFCALGVAVAALSRSADAAPAIVQFILVPLAIISGTYFPIRNALLGHIAGVLPVRPFNEALMESFTGNGQVTWSHLATVFAWGVAGGAVAVRRFQWEPRRG